MRPAVASVANLEPPREAAACPVQMLDVLMLGLIPAMVRAQASPTAVQDQRHQQFSHYFEMQKGEFALPIGPVGATRTTAAAAVQRAPDRDLKRHHLHHYLEQRTAQPDVGTFVAINPIVEEVAAGEDRELPRVFLWEDAALRITANDDASPSGGSNLSTAPFEQMGPAQTSRATVIVRRVLFEAANAIQPEFGSYRNIQATIFSRTGFQPPLAPSDVSVGPRSPRSLSGRSRRSMPVRSRIWTSP